MEKNPQAFSKTTPHMLLAGSVLVIPDHDILLRQYLQASQVDGTTKGLALTGHGDRRDWIRFP
jgi:Tfp pilus assembly protein FimV